MVTNMQRATSAKETAREVIIYAAKIHVLVAGSRNIQNPAVLLQMISFHTSFLTFNLNIRFKRRQKHQLSWSSQAAGVLGKMFQAFTSAQSQPLWMAGCSPSSVLGPTSQQFREMIIRVTS